MRRSTRQWLGGTLLLVGIIVAYIGVRYLISHRQAALAPSAQVSDAAMLREMEDFEQDRQQDSARQQAHWDSVRTSWDRERTQRQLARDERQRKWDEQRAQWAAEKAERDAARTARQAHYDSLRASRPEKLPRGTVVDANHADTTLLQRIPGIGSHYARSIVAYRTALGGFVSAEQLAEVRDLPNGITAWFSVSDADRKQVRRININRANFKTINAHPYMSYEQTRAIFALRRNVGRLRGWDDLRGSGLFDDHDIQRLTPYFTF